jgi:hypothetical protein
LLTHPAWLYLVVKRTLLSLICTREETRLSKGGAALTLTRRPRSRRDHVSRTRTFRLPSAPASQMPLRVSSVSQRIQVSTLMHCRRLSCDPYTPSRIAEGGGSSVSPSPRPSNHHASSKIHPIPPAVPSAHSSKKKLRIFIQDEGHCCYILSK